MDVGIVHGKELPLAGERYSPYADISNEFTDLFEPFMVDLSLLEEMCIRDRPCDIYLFLLVFWHGVIAGDKPVLPARWGLSVFIMRKADQVILYLQYNLSLIHISAAGQIGRAAFLLQGCGKVLS